MIVSSDDDDEDDAWKDGRKRCKGSPISVDKETDSMCDESVHDMETDSVTPSQQIVYGGEDMGDESAPKPQSSEARVADIKVPTSAMVKPSTVPYLFKRGMEIEKSVDLVIMGTSAEYVMAFLDYLKPLGLLR
jgi:hypothetical protein